MTRSGMKEAPALERQGYAGSKVLEHQNPNRNSNNLLEEEVTMSTIIAPAAPVNNAGSRISTAPYQRALRQHVGASKLSYTALAILTGMTLDDFAQKMHETECVFTVGELALLARALRLSPAALIVPPHQAEETLKCVREVCTVRHHQKLHDGRQGDMCRIDNIDSNKDLWNVFALSNQPGDRWDAAIDLTGCDDLEGDTGIAVMREALAAFAKAQAYCNVLNDAEGLN